MKSEDASGIDSSQHQTSNGRRYIMYDVVRSSCESAHQKTSAKINAQDPNENHSTAIATVPVDHTTVSGVTFVGYSNQSKSIS